jgi:hypothetical protein
MEDQKTALEKQKHVRETNSCMRKQKCNARRVVGKVGNMGKMRS